MTNEIDLAALAGRLKFLNILYLALFGASLAMIVLQVSALLWACTLGSAVCVRLYRGSQLNKYNAAKGGPLV